MQNVTSPSSNKQNNIYIKVYNPKSSFTSQKHNHMLKTPSATNAAPATIPVTTTLPSTPLHDLTDVVTFDAAGSSAAACVGCVSTLLGIPSTTTNSRAGPGVSRFGFGGTCDTCNTYDPSLFTVYVLLSCRCRWPMFIAWVVNPPRESTTVVFATTPLADVPLYDVEETVKSK